jgi:nucleotide-binding universal stress UspA family protein
MWITSASRKQFRHDNPRKEGEMTPKTILFAIDFSPGAEKAGLYAKAIARRYASTVHLVHVIDLSSVVQAPDAGVCLDVVRKGGESALSFAREQFASANIRVKTSLAEGLDPARAILQIAHDESIDLIVSGTRGHTGLARLTLGSMAEQLIHNAECPVLTVGPEVPLHNAAGGFERVVYATDFSAEAAKASTVVLSLAQETGAHVYLCHVLPRKGRHHGGDGLVLTEQFSAALQRTIPDVAREWCEPECIVEHGYAADGILLLAQRVNADLIVLGTRRSSHWFDSFKAGIAYDVIRTARCSVLTIRGG